MRIKKQLLFLFVAGYIGSAVGYSSPGLPKQNEQILCKNTDLETFKKNIRKDNLEKVVFFASWCLSCKKHILDANVEKSVFVIAFDDESAALSAITSLFSPQQRSRVRCEYDKSGAIAKFYNVRSLPYQVMINS